MAQPRHSMTRHVVGHAGPKDEARRAAWHGTTRGVGSGSGRHAPHVCCTTCAKPRPRRTTCVLRNPRPRRCAAPARACRTHKPTTPCCARPRAPCSLGRLRVVAPATTPPPLAREVEQASGGEGGGGSGGGGAEDGGGGGREGGGREL